VKVKWGTEEISIDGRVSRIQNDVIVQIPDGIPEKVTTKQILKVYFLGKHPISTRSQKAASSHQPKK